MNSIINANIQNNIKTQDIRNEEKAYAPKSSNLRDKGHGDAEDPEAPKRASRSQGKGQKIELNKSANFQETMSKIFSDLNKTLDVVNLSMGRASSEGSIRSRRSTAQEKLVNVFKNNFESNEKQKAKEKPRSKSWFEVTNQLNQQHDKSGAKSPSAKEKSKSLIMTDLDEFMNPPVLVLSPNKQSLETKKGHLLLDEEQDDESDPDPPSPRNKIESQSMKPPPTNAAPEMGVLRNTIRSEKQKPKQPQKNRFLNFKSKINLSGTLPESNNQDYAAHSDSESEKAPKLFFFPGKGVVKGVPGQLGLAPKPIPPEKNRIIRHFSKPRYEEDLVSKTSDNRFISYKRTKYQKYIVKKKVPQSMTDNLVLTDSVRKPKKMFAENDIRRSNQSPPSILGNIGRPNSIRTRYKNQMAKASHPRLPDDMSRVLFEDVTSKYMGTLTSRMDSSSRHYPPPPRTPAFTSQYSTSRGAQNPGRAFNAEKKRHPVRFYSNVDNAFNFHPNSFRQKHSEYPAQSYQRYSKRRNFDPMDEFGPYSKRNGEFLQNVGNVEDHLVGLFQILMAFRSQINDLKMRLFLRNNYFDIRLFLVALLRKQIVKGIYGFSLFSDFLSRLDLPLSQSKTLSLMLFIARHHSSPRKLERVGFNLHSQQMFNFFRLNLYPREVSQSYSLDVSPEEFDLVRRIFVITGQMIRDTSQIIKSLRRFSTEDVFTCLVKGSLQNLNDLASSLYQSCVMPEDSPRNTFLKTSNLRFLRPKQTSIEGALADQRISSRAQLRHSHLLSDFKESRIVHGEITSSLIKTGSKLIPEGGLLRKYMKSYLYTTPRVAPRISRTSNDSALVLTNKIVDQFVIEGFLEAQNVKYNKFEVKYIFEEIAGDIRSFDFQLFTNYLKADFLNV